MATYDDWLDLLASGFLDNSRSPFAFVEYSYEKPAFLTIDMLGANVFN